jgi:hypothetical protein
LVASCGKPNDPSDYTGGYKIVKKLATAGDSNDVIKDGNLCYLTQGEGGLLIVDVSNPSNPTKVSSLSEGVRGYSIKIAKKEDIVYITANSYGVSVVDVSNTSAPEVTSSNLNMKPAKNLHVMGDYLITAISEQGFKMAYLEEPAYPDIRGLTHTNGYAKGVTTSADASTLFVATGEMGLSLFDISVIDDGYGTYPHLGWMDLPGYAESIALKEDASIAFVACGDAGLQIVDYSNTSNLKVIGSYDTGGHANEIKYQNGKVYITAESGGLQIFDVSDASEPKLLGIIDTEDANGLDIDQDYIYVADTEEGLIIVEIK